MVHEVEKNLKLNLANNYHTEKGKYSRSMPWSTLLGYIYKSEFWSKLMILIRLHRQLLENETYKLNSNHAN